MNNSMKVEFPANSDNERFARNVAAAFILELDPTLDELSEIKTAVSEAVTNAIIHGYNEESGTVIMEGYIKDNEIEFVISDSGNGIEDIDKAREPLYTGKPEMERSGMGFTIMETFMDEVIVKSKVGEGTVIRMSKRIEQV
ncbi:MAG: anti-sigma F factor [Clostridia bacterium]|nr:anti-sigma F factor [Clostridia bacterium]